MEIPLAASRWCWKRSCQVFGYGFATKLSSAGLVYKHFGLEIIANVLRLDEDHPHVHQLYPTIYRNFVEAVDAVDNGVSQMALAGGEFVENVNYYAKSWLPARSIVMECLAARETLYTVGVEMQTLEEIEKLDEELKKEKIKYKRRMKELKQQEEELRKSITDQTQEMMAEIQSLVEKMVAVTKANRKVEEVKEEVKEEEEVKKAEGIWL